MLDNKKNSAPNGGKTPPVVTIEYKGKKVEVPAKLWAHMFDALTLLIGHYDFEEEDAEADIPTSLRIDFTCFLEGYKRLLELRVESIFIEEDGVLDFNVDLRATCEIHERFQKFMTEFFFLPFDSLKKVFEAFEVVDQKE